MNKFIKVIGFFLAGLVTMFQPMQTAHGVDGCCATCTMKKEEDEIELIEEVDNIEK